MKGTLFFLIIIFNSISIQAQNTFDVLLHPMADIYMNSITKTHDKGFILCGSVVDSIDGTRNFYFEKYDSLGQYQWNHQLVDSFVSGYDEEALHVFQDYDDDFIFIGTVNSVPYDLYNQVGYIGKFNSQGSYFWAEILYADMWSNGDNIVPTNDSGFVLMYHAYDGTGSHTERTVKYDKFHSETWSGYAGAYTYCNNDLAVNQNSFFVSLARSYEYYYSFDCEYQTVVSGGNATTAWQFPFSCVTGSSLINGVCSTVDNGAIVCGQLNLYGDADVSLVYISPTGDSLFTRVYGERNKAEVAVDIALCSDSGYIITGYSSDTCLAGNTNIFLLKLNSNGDSLWYKTFGGYNTNIGYKVLETENHGYMISGYTHDLSGVNSIRVIKTDSSGNVFYPLEINANNNCPVYCLGDTATLSINNLYPHYLWSTGDTTLEIHVINSGVFSVAVQDSLGNSYTSPGFSVFFLSPPNAQLDSFITGCGNVRLRSLAATASYDTFHWYLDNSIIPSARSYYYDADTSGIYKLIVSNLCGIDSAEAQIIVHQLPPNPDIQVSPSATFCVGDSARLYTTAQNYSYQWYSAFHNLISGATDSFYYSTVDNGGYWVQTTDSFGCSSISTFVRLQVLYQNQPYLSINPDPICQGDTAIISASIDVISYLWNTGDTTRTVFTTTSNDYYCILNYGYTCQYLSDTVHATILQNPIVNLGNDTTICVPGFIILDPGNNGNIKWQDGTSSPTYVASGFFADTVDYSVQIESYYGGCLSYDTIQIIYQICTGVNSLDQSKNCSVFPIPARNSLYVALNNTEQIKSVSVFNMMSQMKDVNFYQTGNVEYYELDLHELSPGIYILEILTDRQKIVSRFIKE